MAYEYEIEILRRGKDVWNAWRAENRTIIPNPWGPGTAIQTRMIVLRGANLPGINLGGDVYSGGVDLNEIDLSTANLCGASLELADLSSADLSDANLSDVMLINANMKRAKLRGANLHRANLMYADLREVDLRDADLSEAWLQFANFDSAILDGADLSRAYFGGNKVTNVNMRNIIGLESVIYTHPSSIGVDTIYLSGGKIPEVFLRGAGVPESLTRQISALVGAEDGLQFYSCFISYSHKDEDFAKRLYERMRAVNLRVWFAPEDMPGGKKLHEEIETQIHIHDKLLLVLSEHSLQSEWVATEIYHARQRELSEKRQILFPIALCPHEEIRKWKAFDADSGKDMAREIREYFIPDFTDWKNHDSFERDFERLLRDLRANDSLPSK